MHRLPVKYIFFLLRIDPPYRNRKIVGKSFYGRRSDLPLSWRETVMKLLFRFTVTVPELKQILTRWSTLNLPVLVMILHHLSDTEPDRKLVRFVATTPPHVTEENLMGSGIHLLGIINLPGPCADWTFSFNLCCRNWAITNIDVPGNTLMYIYATLNNNR